MASSSQRMFLMNPDNVAFIQKKVQRPIFPEMSASGLWGLLAVALVVAVLFLIYAIPAWRNWLALSNAGASVPGQVADYRFETREVSYFYVSYSYPVDNQLYMGEQRVSFDQFNLVPDIGQNIPVRYALNSPGLSKLDTPFEDFGDLRVPITYFGGGFLLIMLVALAIHGDRRMKNSELVAKGKLVKGVIVSSYGNQPERDSGAMQMFTLLFGWAWYVLRRRNQSQFKVKVRYTLMSPLSHKELTKTETIVRNDLDRRSVPEPGTPVAVLFRADKHFRLL